MSDTVCDCFDVFEAEVAWGLRFGLRVENTNWVLRERANGYGFGDGEAEKRRNRRFRSNIFQWEFLGFWDGALGLCRLKHRDRNDAVPAMN